MKFLVQTTVFCLLLLSSCNSISKSNLIGKWQAVSLYEDGKTENFDLSAVEFEFNKDGSYYYTGTLAYKEVGFFDLKNNFLYTIDTLNNGTTEKSVQILSLSGDSLSIKMVENNLDRILKLIRKE